MGGVDLVQDPRQKIHPRGVRVKVPKRAQKVFAQILGVGQEHPAQLRFVRQSEQSNGHPSQQEEQAEKHVIDRGKVSRGPKLQAALRERAERGGPRSAHDATSIH
jgi:hypothetical protein